MLQRESSYVTGTLCQFYDSAIFRDFDFTLSIIVDLIERENGCIIYKILNGITLLNYISILVRTPNILNKK